MRDNIDNIYPIELQEKYNYLEIGNKYVSTLLIIGYPRNIEMFQFVDVFDSIGKSNISIFIEKEEKAFLLKKITKIIATSKEELITTHENRADVDKLNTNIQSAKLLRNAIQVDNEDVYRMKIYICIVEENLQKLKARQKEIINFFYSKEFILKPSNFRQKDTYLSTLPLLYNNQTDNDLMTKYITSKSLANLFPFYTRNMIEKDGIILGETDNKLCVFDIFSNNHSNCNTTVLGSSGSGKSYLLKLMILRNAYLGVKQIIFDPEGEYSDIVNKVGGQVINPREYNFLYIAESLVKSIPSNFLEKKISILINQINENILLNEKETVLINKLLKQVYLENGITENIQSLFVDFQDNKFYMKKKYKAYSDFPTISDLIEKLNKTRSIDKIRKQEIINVLSRFSKVSKDVDIQNSNIISYNLSNLNTQEFKIYMNMLFWQIEEIKEEKSLIYIDEIWKCVSFGSDEILTEKIFNMFKTIRKEKMGIITSTQDISDFFTYKNGLFGRSILNNSYNKIIFNLQYIDIEDLSKAINQSQENINRMKFYERGKAFMQIGNCNFEIKVQASKWEHDLIEGRQVNEENVNSTRKPGAFRTNEENRQIFNI